MITPKTDKHTGHCICNATEEKDVVPRSVSASLEDELEWLYANCRIVFYPPDKSYPIEHAPAARKDARWLLDEARAKWSNDKDLARRALDSE